MPGSFQVTLREYGTQGKASRVRVHIPTLTAGNIAAQIGLAADWQAAVQATQLGELNATELVADLDKITDAASLNTAAQRELKWLVSCVEATTGNSVRFEIPCADTSLLSTDGESMDTASTEYADLVAATEAFVRSNDGNTVTVSFVKMVGRSI